MLSQKIAKCDFESAFILARAIEKTDGTVYGDGVNIASRLQALAEPGGVMVSDMVQGALRDRVPVNYEDAGDHNFKKTLREQYVSFASFRTLIPTRYPTVRPLR
jgi:hypothetical protein